MSEIVKKLEKLLESIVDLKQHLKLSEKKQKLLELEDTMQTEGFWNDRENAQLVSQNHSKLKDFVDFWDDLENDTRETLGLSQNNTDESAETIEFLEKHSVELEKSFTKNRLVALLSKKYDDHDAIFSLHAGAGGIDAQDWTEMLLRMYLRYCENRGFKTEILDISRNPEAGIKSVTVQVSGPYAYGYFKSEAGVHRLVRLSPFNPAHTRETSFSLLELLPALEEKESVDLDPSDLKIEATTSSGHGGQSVNTTYSAIRITHIPTGLKVSIQNERSQAQNRELAMKILRGKLQAFEDERIAKEKKDLRGEFKSAEWGNQIRNYVLHPYQLVKDVRTGLETSDTQKVLDGEIEEFVEKYLEMQVSK